MYDHLSLFSYVRSAPAYVEQYKYVIIYRPHVAILSSFAYFTVHFYDMISFIVLSFIPIVCLGSNTT